MPINTNKTSTLPLYMDINKKLQSQAQDILAANWTELSKELGFTKPAIQLYPFQWHWDSGFIAYGYTHYNLNRAIKELRTLFRGQWQNGFVPHIIFHGECGDYFPGPNFWQSHLHPAAPPRLPTSGLTQPPLSAWVIWHIYKQLKDRQTKIKLLEEFYPKLYKLHKYLLSQRDPEQWGLVTIYHP